MPKNPQIPIGSPKIFDNYSGNLNPTQPYAPEPKTNRSLTTPPEELQVWDQQPPESSVAYSAFLVYVNLGVGRTVIDAYRIYRNKPQAENVDGSFNKWKNRFQWLPRAIAYDQWYRTRNLLQQEEVILNSMAIRQEQSAGLRDRMFNMADSLIEKAEKMLAFPLEEISRAEMDGGKTTIVTVKPIRWSISDIRPMIQLADQLRRSGLDPQETTQILRAEDIVEQMAEAEGLTREQVAAAVANLKSMQKEPKTGRSASN